MLTQKKCVPCEGGVEAFTSAQVDAMMEEVPGWERAVFGGAPAIARHYKFKDFAEALAFTNKVGAIAEEEGHHPDIALGWGYVSVVLTTHAVKGLHENDFIVAAKINALCQASAA